MSVLIALIEHSIVIKVIFVFLTFGAVISLDQIKAIHPKIVGPFLALIVVSGIIWWAGDYTALRDAYEWASSRFQFSPPSPLTSSPGTTIVTPSAPRRVIHAVYDEAEAALAAARRGGTICARRKDGGYIAAFNDKDWAGHGPTTIVESAFSDDNGGIRFGYSGIQNGRIAWMDHSQPGERSDTKSQYDAGTFAASTPNAWGATFRNAARAFFTTCGF